MDRRVPLTAVSLLLVAGNLPAARQGSAPSRDTPTFRVQVDYVEVDVIATDRRGALIRDLQKDDFQVLEDGRRQTVSAFSAVDVPVERYSRPSATNPTIEPDTATNARPFDGRVYVLVIDDLHTFPGRMSRVRALGRTFIEEHLADTDLMAVVHTAGPADGSQDFTSNKRLLLAAVDRTIGWGFDSPTVMRTAEFNQAEQVRQPGDPVVTPVDPLAGERNAVARQALDYLKHVTDWVAGLRGLKKTIIFVSEGMEMPTFGLLLDTVQTTIAAATRANVSIYGIDPRAMTQLADETIGVQATGHLETPERAINAEVRRSQELLQTLSEETGGFAAVNTNDVSTAFDRIVRDSSTYYVLAYYPPPAQPGKAHRIEVKVNRPGVTLRARKGYVTPRLASSAPTNSSATRPTTAPPLMAPALRTALESPMPVSGLTMRVFAAPFQGMGPNALVVLGIDVRGTDLRLNPNDALTVSYVAIDADGKMRGAKTATMTMNLQPDTKGRTAQLGFRVLGRLDLPAGHYQLRIAAQDGGGGGVGSVLYDLDVPDFAKLPLSMSGISISSIAGSQAPVAYVDDSLRSMVTSIPVAQRTFARNDELVISAEVYDNEAKPHAVDLAATIASAAGQVVFTGNERRESNERDPSRGRYAYTTRIRMQDLEPGPYVLTISARSGLAATAITQRQVAFAIEDR